MKKEKYLFMLVIVFAIVIRFYELGYLPGNGALNQDEAYVGYEAWSLLHYKMDSHGYQNPIYFETWGSGMNAVYIYDYSIYCNIWIN